MIERALLVVRYLLSLAADVAADDIRKHILEPAAADFLVAWTEYAVTVTIVAGAASALAGLFWRKNPSDVEIAAARARLEAEDLLGSLRAPRRHVDNRPEMRAALRAAGVWSSAADERRAAWYRRAGALAITVPCVIRIVWGPAWTWPDSLLMLFCAGAVSACLCAPGPARSRLGNAVRAADLERAG